jgi:LysR family hydrogen peroxide-inducible transcriptional activator
VELRQLRAVEAVNRHRHFTRAAEELHVAQSAPSHQIRRLEQELGTALFERTSRRFSPTEAGQAVAGRARRVLAEVDGLRQEVDELRGVLGLRAIAPPRRTRQRTTSRVPTPARLPSPR